MVKNQLFRAVASLLVAALSFSCSGPAVNIVGKSFDEQVAGRYKISVRSSFYNSSDEELNEALEPLNDSLSSIVGSIVGDFAENMGFTGDSLPGESDFERELDVRDTVCSATKKLVSVRYTVYQYSGGAHGNTTSFALNYLPEQRKFLERGEFFKVGENVADSLLQSHFVNADSVCYAVPTVELASSINFTEDEVIFIYDRYVIAPYSAGEVEIRVPASELGL